MCTRNTNLNMVNRTRRQLTSILHFQVSHFCVQNDIMGRQTSNGVDATVNDDCSRLDPICFHHLRTTHCHHNYICLAHLQYTQQTGSKMLTASLQQINQNTIIWYADIKVKWQLYAVIVIKAITTTTVLRPFFRDHPGEPVPEENFWTLWCKGRLTEADTPTIRISATPSGLTSAPLHHPLFFTGRMPFLPPNQQRQSTEGN